MISNHGLRQIYTAKVYGNECEMSTKRPDRLRNDKNNEKTEAAHGRVPRFLLYSDQHDFK